MNFLLAEVPSFVTPLIIVIAIAVVLIAVFVFLPLAVWFRAFVSGAHIPLSRLIGIKLRKINMKLLVESYISSKKAGIDLSIDELETHIMAGGNILNVVNALISAHSANIVLTPQTAKAIDLAGRDVLAAVKFSVNPKVIETPVIAAIAKDGIELRAKARVTVRANIARLVGGAGEDTIIARV
ncbi:MAG: flotillin-like FloA family protein, partial [Clostridia bacterium]